ncbi:MAG: gamma-glutamyl-gamma-aminobutyrate hydrolase family protein [bacterium]
MKPQIAFSCNHNPVYDKDGWEVLGPHFYIYSSYIKPIVELGGAPLIVPVMQNKDYYADALRDIKGLILVGGGDVNPFIFGRPVEHKIGKVNPDMDYGEIEMTKVALEMNIPILAICRGIQVLNVVAGGTLHQHLPKDIPDCFNHSTKFPPDTLAHWVKVDPNSLLFRILEIERISTNSNHHQAVSKIGQGVMVCGRTDDGVIEAIEMPQKKWVLGVQWHPEILWESHDDHRRIFQAFVKACEG